jgi:hypothetical protein
MEVYYVKTVGITENGESDFTSRANKARMYATVDLAVEEIKSRIANMTSSDFAWPGIKASFDEEKLCGYSDGPCFKRKYVIMRKTIREEVIDLENPFEHDEEVTGK